MLKDTEAFSTQMTGRPITPLCAEAQETLRRRGFTPVTTLGSDDGPLHMRRRRSLMELFTPAHLERWAPRIREVVGGYIDRFAGNGSAELVSELFWEAPAVVALEFMGVPEHEVQLAKQFAAGIMNFKFGRPSEREQVATCELMGDNQDYARGLLERIKRDPSGEAFLHVLVRAWREEPEAFDDSFLLGLATTTVAAAHETTSHAQANSILLLLRRRERWEALCRNPQLIPAAVEESLRLGPSLTALQRLCIKDSVVGDVTIPAGAKVLLSIVSGNADDDAFAHATEFEPGRRNVRRHLAFGSGPHVCLGAGLARVQMRVVLEELTRRLPHLRLTPGVPITYQPSASPHGPRELWVEWDPNDNP
ncbi:MAG TPA: cytochrome P450 [Solirubrobacteraceae bacterium]|nr:cytochrome P450 [Solirubrobacteraceae bacterium]